MAGSVAVRLLPVSSQCTTFSYSYKVERFVILSADRRRKKEPTDRPGVCVQEEGAGSGAPCSIMLPLILLSTACLEMSPDAATRSLLLAQAGGSMPEICDVLGGPPACSTFVPR